MKTLSVQFFLLSFSIVSVTASQAQELANTEWIKIKEERKDGSTILYANYLNEKSVTFRFDDKLLFISIDNQFSGKQKYLVRNNVLNIGSQQKYTIDTLTGLVLSLTEIPINKVGDDKINRYIFVKSRYFFTYAKETQPLQITADSVIQCTRHFSPTYTGRFDGVFAGKFKGDDVAGNLTGSFILSSGGIVKDIQIDSSATFSDEDIVKFTSALKTTSGSWTMPGAPSVYQYKIDFVCYIRGDQYYPVVHCSFHTKDPKVFNETGLALDDKVEEQEHFRKGTTLFKHKKYDMAATEFERCIQINALNLDAYYNLGYAYQNLGKKEFACNVWQKLTEMGQTQGKRMYAEYCK